MQLRRDKKRDAVGRPSWRSSFLRDPGAEFFGGKLNKQKNSLNFASTCLKVVDNCRRDSCGHPLEAIVLPRVYGAAFKDTLFDCQSTPSNSPYPIGKQESERTFCVSWERHCSWSFRLISAKLTKPRNLSLSVRHPFWFGAEWSS